jgi:hypothetical protein
MGVMACSRKGCDNIMCQTYIPEIGYICSSCQAEFKEMYKDIDFSDGLEITMELEKFMDINKSGELMGKMSISDYFEQYTRH